MAKDRLTPCINYMCEKECKKGRKAEFKGLCQTCKDYQPRARVRHHNSKKDKLEKIRKNENEI